jgi:hypothetical protein
MHVHACVAAALSSGDWRLSDACNCSSQSGCSYGRQVAYTHTYTLGMRQHLLLLLLMLCAHRWLRSRP